MYSRCWRLPKTWLDKCLKSPVSEDLFRTNTEIGPNTVEIRWPAPLPYLLITLEAIELERISLSDMQNVTTIC